MIEVYMDKRLEWRWRYRARNGKITADGGEGYKREWEARRSARRTGLAMSVAKIKEIGYVDPDK